MKFHPINQFIKSTELRVIDDKDLFGAVASNLAGVPKPMPHQRDGHLGPQGVRQFGRLGDKRFEFFIVIGIWYFNKTEKLFADLA